MRNSESIFHTVSNVCGSFSNPAESKVDCQCNGALSSSLTDHNPPPEHKGKTKNHRHHDCHNPPASSGLNLRGKCNRRSSRDRLRWFRCGHLIFIDKIIFFLVVFTIILCASAGRAGGQKVSFLCYFIVFFLFPWFDTTRTDPSYLPNPFFSMTPPVLIMF